MSHLHFFVIGSENVSTWKEIKILLTREKKVKARGWYGWRKKEDLQGVEARHGAVKKQSKVRIGI